MEKLGIIAGAGELPVLLAQAAQAQGRLPIIIQLTQTPSEGLAGVASEIYPIGVGQMRKITRTLLESDVREIVLIGKIHKGILLHPFLLDTTALKILATTRNKGDRALLAAIIAHFESSGLSVIEQHRFLGDLMPSPGVLTKKQPTQSQWADVRYGMQLARQVANLDIGQTVIVKDLMPLAVEAIEGTDEAIRRGGALGGKGVVVAKAASPHHDFRIDVPTVGHQTLEVLHEVKGGILAVEAGRTFIINQEALCEQADRWKVAIVAVA
ncbi:UDP-2,3-diacylglucosamine diphosphatase LpxI [Candidatus Poribacteria bacterium]|nr:UDP-2,3-diacylglucosamine diphosphatase LpxI [Candidatus Poribacteria bacterium]